MQCHADCDSCLPDNPHAEHVAVLEDRRTDIRLAELDKQVGLDRLQPRHYLSHQSAGGLLDAFRVASGVVLRHRRIRAGNTEVVNEVELESVNVPVPQRLLIGADKKGAALRETRVQHTGAKALVEILSFEAGIVGGLRADERHREPDHVSDAHLLYTPHVRRHVRESS